MITLRRSSERGRTKLNPLDSRHTFSFGDYCDPQHMVFRELRVVNEDRVNSRCRLSHAHSHLLGAGDQPVDHREPMAAGSRQQQTRAEALSFGSPCRLVMWGCHDITRIACGGDGVWIGRSQTLILSKGSESSAHPETRTITASGGPKTCRRSHTWRRFDFGVLRDFLRKDELSQSAALLSRS